MATYNAIPNSSHQTVEVSTGTAIKTVLQVATPSTTDILVLGWSVSFQGVVVTDAPIIATLIDTNVAATVTSLTPGKYGNRLAPASLCVGGTSATGYNASAEGTITDSTILDSGHVHPQGAYGVWFPKPQVVAVSRFLRIRVLAAVSVDCIPMIVWKEPAES